MNTSKLKVTLIDVGSGDSILIESTDNNDKKHYGLIDSNDHHFSCSSLIFIKKYFEKIGLDREKPTFEFIMLSHWHLDHGQGLKTIIKKFGTKYFWYPNPKLEKSSPLAEMLRYCKRSSNVDHYEAIDNRKELPKLGEVALDVLWPPKEYSDTNENNNSIVLTLQLGEVSFVLTGDADNVVWEKISEKIPENTMFFKVPHHGSKNGTSDSGGWLLKCPSKAVLGISSHTKPYKHPDDRVIKRLNERGFKYCKSKNIYNLFRTDENYHLTFETTGNNLEVKYSHSHQIEMQKEKSNTFSFNPKRIIRVPKG